MTINLRSIYERYWDDLSKRLSDYSKEELEADSETTFYGVVFLFLNE
ncbi:hypothetical protein [Heliorestis acidaminivorans]|nr:hypothetical protein [Heliorestis acidaminivorans]